MLITIKKTIIIGVIFILGFYILKIKTVDSNISSIGIYTKTIDKSIDYEPEMLNIKRGTFIMGTDTENDYEKPAHKVTIDYDFEIGKYELTIGQYKHFIEETQSNYPEWLEKGSKYNIYTGTIEGDTKEYKKMCLEDNCPIMGISWENAKAYIDWLNTKTNKKYRLPSEAEWEYVVRAASTSTWNFGNSVSSLTHYAWYKTTNQTHRVGLKEANDFGTYDMYGNVWEWCEDSQIYFYKNTPVDGSAYISEEESRKILRGASWRNDDLYVTSTTRTWDYPSSRSDNVGFRLARTLP